MSLFKLCSLLATLSLASSLSAQSPPVREIAGLWGAEARFGAPIEGVLTLDGRHKTWQALIAGYQVSVRVDGNAVDFTLPGARGTFRGHRDTRRNIIFGHWIQSGGLILDPEYATPVELQATAPQVWQTNIVPLDQRLSVYLKIVSSDTGLTATASNPEANFFRGRLYQIVQNGSKVSIETGGKRFEGTYDEESSILSIQLVTWLPPFQFTRRSANTGVGFYARTPAEAHDWIYQEPLPGRDGWTTSTLHAEEVGEALIARLIRKITQSDAADNPPNIQSLLIARHGRLVLEEYFHGFSQDRVHDMRSAGKTFAPVLAGIANAAGSSVTPGTLVYPLFPAYGPFAHLDSRKQQVSLRDIMTMTAGNACDDNDDNSPGNEDRMQSSSQKDWYKYTLDLPMLKEPGGNHAVYCSGDLNLVGGVVAAATKTWLPDLFEEKLARPMQFGRYYLNLMPDRQAYMGGGAYLRPRDQIKLGQLYLNGGVWNGKRIVSTGWVDQSTSVHSRFEDARSLGQKHEYGFGWHIHDLHSGGQEYRVFAAEGNGGQFVIVIPRLDLVVGITGGAYGEFDKWYRWELELLPEFIIPAAESGLPH